MKLLTHPSFVKRRNDIERRSFDDLYNLLEQYTYEVSSLIASTKNEFALEVLGDLGILIYTSKIPSLTSDERLRHANLINATVKLMNVILKQSAVVDDYEPSLVDTAIAVDHDTSVIKNPSLISR